MQWKFTGGEPVYRQIMEQLRDAVLSGVYLPGARIPSVREIAAEAKVNPNTVQRALSELEREGLLESHGTLGRCVTDNGSVLDRLHRDAVEKLAQECVLRFRALGLEPEQAAALLLEQKEA